MSEMKKIPTPLNSEEKYLYGICQRLDKIIDLIEPKEGEEVEMSDEEFYSHVELEEKKTNKDYESMTKAELKEYLDELGVEYSSRANKGELLDLLQK